MLVFPFIIPVCCLLHNFFFIDFYFFQNTVKCICCLLALIMMMIRFAVYFYFAYLLLLQCHVVNLFEKKSSNHNNVMYILTLAYFSGTERSTTTNRGQGCNVEGDRFHPAGSSWHPYMPPNGFMVCTTCTCRVSFHIHFSDNNDKKL